MAYGFGWHRVHDDTAFFLRGLCYWLWFFGCNTICNRLTGFGFFRCFLNLFSGRGTVGVRLRLYLVEFDGLVWTDSHRFTLCVTGDGR